jgi:hypothetical protein
MRRVGRYMLNTLAVLSLVLCVAMALLRVCSNHGVRWSTGSPRTYWIGSLAGEMYFGSNAERVDFSRSAFIEHDTGLPTTFLDLRPERQFQPEPPLFDAGVVRSANGYLDVELAAPAWWVLLASLIMPLWCLAVWRRRRYRVSERSGSLSGPARAGDQRRVLLVAVVTGPLLPVANLRLLARSFHRSESWYFRRPEGESTGARDPFFSPFSSSRARERHPLHPFTRRTARR